MADTIDTTTDELRVTIDMHDGAELRGVLRYSKPDGWIGIQIDGERVVHEWPAERVTLLLPAPQLGELDAILDEVAES